MDISLLQRHFRQVGASLEVQVIPTPIRAPRRWGAPAPEPFWLDVRQSGTQEHFRLTVSEAVRPHLVAQVVHLDPARRHLLLLLQPTPGDKQKFLCGHDERHWFVAAVPDVGGLVTVQDAMEALKPELVRASQRARGVRAKHWHRRHNRGFIRQGEWFFLPRPTFEPDERFVLHHEPIRRGAGKPHWVEWLYREGGTTVYVCPRYPAGLGEADYQHLLASDPAAKRWSWRLMRREPRAFARGKVRHPDHATIELRDWHRIVMSGERTSPTVVFLD